MKKLLTSSMLWLLFTFTICIWMDYSSELRQAYNWAYQSDITTQSSIEKANMWWKITREEMAKMISNYAINILWKSPDTTKSCLFSDSNINPDLVRFVTESCQLWLMWQWITSFKPRDFVTRAEFWTVLSRALWWDKYGWWNTYYESHLKALQCEWIMKKIDMPMDNEIRWYVMLMLMRSVNQKTDYNDDQISEVIQLLD
jgi:hypothetical protein